MIEEKLFLYLVIFAIIAISIGFVYSRKIDKTLKELHDKEYDAWKLFGALPGILERFETQESNNTSPFGPMKFYNGVLFGKIFSHVKDEELTKNLRSIQKFIIGWNVSFLLFYLPPFVYQILNMKP